MICSKNEKGEPRSLKVFMRGFEPIWSYLRSRRVSWFFARLVSIQSFLHSVSVAVTICGSALRCRDSKRYVIENYFSVWKSYKFLISICRAEQVWRLCSSCHLAKIMPLCSARISSELRRLTCWKQIRPLRCTILYARWQEPHRPRSEYPLQSQIRNLYDIRTEK